MRALHLGLGVLVTLSPACRVKSAIHRLDPDFNRMLQVPRYDAYERGEFFADKKVLQTPPEGTEPYPIRGRGAPLDPKLREGQDLRGFVTEFPLDVDRGLVETGRDAFGRTCAPCHGLLGDANTVVASRMFRPPPSLHEPRIAEMPVGKIFYVITHGYGLMPEYATHLDVRERWAVVAYVRALEQSQHTLLSELPPGLRGDALRRLQ